MIQLKTTDLEQIRRRAVTAVEALLLHVGAGTTTPHSWEKTFAALEALPLDRNEIAVARNRLANARAYQGKGETGACCYELRLLARYLSRR